VSLVSERGSSTWKKILSLRTLLILSLVALYFVVLGRSLTEAQRRSLRLRDDTDSADHVLISVLVTGVNPATQELTAQISFRPQGELAQDEVTPAADLTLLTNNVRSQEEFDFPKGKRMNRIAAVFPLNGELNKYPFDQYRTTLSFLMTTPILQKRRQSSTIPQSPEVPASKSEEELRGDRLAVGTTALQRSVTVPLTITLSASTPGVKFEGDVSRKSSSEVTGIELKTRRADNVIAVSILLMTLMVGLAISLLSIVIIALTTKASVGLVPLTISISLIFGLPALRNVQPGVPPVGALGDYVAFIWAEISVGVSAITIAWIWILRSREASQTGDPG
jgi:Domain of unknown function (DUF4436)